MSWLANPAVTAWIQAIGSLLAIAAVFMIERIERRREQQQFKREAQVRAEQLAVALTAYIIDVQQQVGKISRRLSAIRADQRPGGSLEEFEIWIPPVIEQAWDRFGELGPVLGAAMVELLARGGRYRQAVGRHGLVVQDWEPLKADVERMETLLDETIVPGLEKIRNRFIKAASI